MASEMPLRKKMIAIKDNLTLIRPGAIMAPSAIFQIVRERIRMAPRRSQAFFFRVLRIFWNKFFENRTYR